MTLVIANPFDQIKRMADDGSEYWLATELMSLLGYQSWKRIKDTVERAIASAKNTGMDQHHFAEVVQMAQIGGSQAFREVVKDFKLSRYACYLTAMNGDPRKPEIAAAQSYFAVKTREAETVIPQQSDRLRELELELALAQAQAQRALAEKSVLDTRHLIVVTCPEAIQQKILGYQSVIEYRDRIVHGEELINDGTTITKTELCKRYGLRTKNGSPDYRALNRLLANNPISPEAWTMKARIQDVPELKREYLSDLDKIFDASDRQRYLGEGS